MKLSRNYLIAFLAVVALWLMFMRPSKSGFSMAEVIADIRSANPLSTAAAPAPRPFA